VKVFDTSSWQEMLNRTDLARVALGVEFAPSGSTLAIAGGDSAAGVVRLPRAKSVNTLWMWLGGLGLPATRAERSPHMPGRGRGAGRVRGRFA
jgi:hypothetical protein